MSQDMMVSIIVLVSPLLFVLTSILSKYYNKQKTTSVIKFAKFSSLFALLAAIVASVIVISRGVINSTFWEFSGLGISVRLDSVSLIMFSMVALLSIVIIRYSGNYLDGDERQGIFMGRLSATIASVQLLVISGNLFLLFIAWVGTSLALHRLLIYYPDRKRAQIAAKKKFIIARLADLLLLTSIILLYLHFHTAELRLIFSSIKNNPNGTSDTIEIAAVLMAFSALLKSAQFPTHGWLIEVMETPTPVSSLLHAGLLNAGPFLMVRMAFVIQSSTYAPVVLIVVGGFSALFASVVFLTQPSIKTALGYSSMAHMGFSLMLSGFGVYSAAMLHLVAHSFYKAHSFLSSGSIIDNIKNSSIDLPKRKGSIPRIILGFILSIVVYLGIAWLWNVKTSNELALLSIGLIIVVGTTRLISATIDSEGSIVTTIKIILLTGVVTSAFFFLERGIHKLLRGEIPELSSLSLTGDILIILFLVLSIIIVGAQLKGPLFKANTFWKNQAVHFRNGWYLNARFDNLIGALNRKNQ
ncbi:MAG: hypothetical protein JXR65_04685 [Bacteroidales bacterium]|nr:hypothetical protein [Bacteroidales bacterium]